MMTARKVCARLQDSETMVIFTNVLSGTSGLIGKAARQFKKSEWQRLIPGEAFALRWDHQSNMATPHPTAMTVASWQYAPDPLKSRAKVKGRFGSSTTDALCAAAKCGFFRSRQSANRNAYVFLLCCWMASERRSSQAAWSASANQPCAMSVNVCLVLRSVARAAPCCASFNGKFRAECLNAHWFMSLDDARRKCEAWRRDYKRAS